MQSPCMRSVRALKCAAQGGVACWDDRRVGRKTCLDTGGSEAYYYHQDANYRVIALTDESANVVERYRYTAYGEPCVAITCGPTTSSTVERTMVERFGC